MIASLALAALLGTAGCGGEPTAAEDEGWVTTRRYQFDPELAPEVASGLSVAEVIARGDGCPPGNWFTEISQDGKSFRVRLIGYEAGIDETLAHAGKTCALSIKLRSRVPVAFALRSVAYLGYAFLQEGVRASFETRSSFDDDAPRWGGDALELIGPYEADIVQQAQAEVLHWSQCGRVRDVQVETKIGVQNATPRGIGYISIDDAHGALPTAVDTARFGITFAVRTCGDSVDASVPTIDAPADAGVGDTLLPAIRLQGGLDGGVPYTEHAATDTK